MRETTLLQLKTRLEEVIKQGQSFQSYCIVNGINNGYFSTKRDNLIEAYNNPITNKLAEDCINLYNSVKGVSKIEFPTIESPIIESNDYLEVAKDDKVNSEPVAYTLITKGTEPKYYFNLKKKSGYFTEFEIDLLVRSYVKKGLNQTKAQLTRIFIDYSEAELGQILRFLKITKESLPFSPNIVASKSVEELAELESSRKTKMTKVQYEQERIRKIENDYNNLVKKVVGDEMVSDQIKKMYEEIDFSNLPQFIYTPNKSVSKGTALMLHFTDFHIGSKVSQYSLYENNWNEEELYKRASIILEGIKSYGFKFDTIVINLLGDMMDGQGGFTTRGGHPLPQNMDDDDQIAAYTKFMIWFVKELYIQELAGEIKLYSVKSGNHDGVMYQMATTALLATLRLMFPDFVSETSIFKEPMGSYTFKGRRFVIFHGKDEKYMKRPWPLTIDKPTQLFIETWLRKNQFVENEIHILKGDLHQEALSVTDMFTYRSNPSIYGSSDHSQMNYTPVRIGVSYELFINDQMIRGTFDVTK